MVRRSPRLGLASVVCAVGGLVLLTFNFFGMIDGFLTDNNHQIYLFPLFETIVLGETEGSIYVHAGAIGPQEIVLAAFGVVLLLFGLVMLRRRPDIPPPEMMDEEAQRQQLESVPIEVAKSGSSQNLVTRDIVKSVVGERGMPVDQAPPMPFGLRSSEAQAAQETATENILVVAAKVEDEAVSTEDSETSAGETTPLPPESSVVEPDDSATTPIVLEQGPSTTTFAVAEPEPPVTTPAIVEPDPPVVSPVVVEPDPPTVSPVVVEPESSVVDPVVVEPDSPTHASVAETKPTLSQLDDVEPDVGSPTFDTGLPDLDELFNEEMYEDDLTQSTYPELNDVLDSLPDLDDL